MTPAPFVLADAAGVAIPLTPGRTRVEFVDEATYTLDDDSPERFE